MFSISLLVFEAQSGEEARLIEKKLKKTKRNKFWRDLAKDLAKFRILFVAGYYVDESVYPSINFVPVKD